MSVRKVAAWLVILLSATAATTAAAQEAKPFGGEPKDPGIVRSGTVFTVHTGWGTFAAPTCDGCTGQYYARWIGLHVGGMLGTDVALFGGLDFGGQDGRSMFTFDAFVRWFVEERTWIDMGFGSAMLDLSEAGQSGVADFGGYSLHAAVGVDLVQGRAFALDASLRGVVARTSYRGDDSISRYDAAISFQFGATWY
jgi:hypothetical protein